MLHDDGCARAALALLALIGGCVAASPGDAADSADLPTSGASAKGEASAGAAPSPQVRDISTEPIASDDPALQCFRLTAYASPADKSVRYSVPTIADFYARFTIKAPWSGTQYIKSMRSILDNRQVIHHLLLLRQHASGPEGVLANGTGIHNDGDMIYAWAAGSHDLWLGPDVGIEMPAGTLLMLENHYNNRTGGPVADGSGVEVCVTPTKPRNLAGLSYVGTDLIFGSAASGTCTHDSKQPVHLIMAMPHMHEKGVRMRVDWTRADGTTSVLHDAPFDFNYQRQYTYDDVVLQPGDKLTTSCTYAAPSIFGKGTSDEMCIFFALHYPVGALARKSLFQALHGPHTCID